MSGRFEELERRPGFALHLLLGKDPERLGGELPDLRSPALGEVDQAQLQGDEAGVPADAAVERELPCLSVEPFGGPEKAWDLLSFQARRDARARFGDAPGLEDLVQDALVLLFEKRERIENPRAWVASTVWRLAANRHRSAATTRWDSADEKSLPAVAADSGVRLDLASVARHLAPVERRLLGSLVLGRSHREIADDLGIGWKSVGIRVRRLRRKLGPIAADATVRP